MRVSVYVRVSVCVCMWRGVSECMSVSVYVCVSVCVLVFVFMCPSVCVYLSIMQNCHGINSNKSLRCLPVQEAHADVTW